MGSLGGSDAEARRACYALAAAVLLAAVVVELDARRRRRPRAGAPAAKPRRRPPAARRRAHAAPRPGTGLAVGRDGVQPEPRRQPEERPLPEPWDGVRDELGRDPARVLPARDRLGLDPADGRGARQPRHAAGRVHARGRAVPGLGGVREQLRALASRQRRGRLEDARGDHRARRTGRPRPASRLRAPDRPRRAPRPPRADALPAYRAAGRATCSRRPARRARRCASGARGTSRTSRRSSARSGAACDPSSPSLAPAVYARARARAAAGAGRRARRPAARARRDRGAAEVDALRHLGAGVHRRAAEDLVCATRRVWTAARLHRRRRPGRARPPTALAARGCPQPHTIWITETGVGTGARRTSSRAARSPTPPRAAARCTTGSCSGTTTRA